MNQTFTRHIDSFDLLRKTNEANPIEVDESTYNAIVNACKRSYNHNNNQHNKQKLKLLLENYHIAFPLMFEHESMIYVVNNTFDVNIRKNGLAIQIDEPEEIDVENE